jgi:formylglycine-generating enzyme required for sulfatase activity
VRIDPGEFQMGVPDGEKDASGDDIPRHPVTITKPFYLGKYHLQRGQFQSFVKAKEYQTEGEKAGDSSTWQKVSFEQTDKHPVVCVNWNDATAFCQWLDGKARNQVRRELGSGEWHVMLPTEAQWEFACRAGTDTPFHFGEKLNGIQANCDGNVPYGTEEKGPFLKGTTPGGKYAANRWGLHDMHGNAWQWCQDTYDAEYYVKSPIKDPTNQKKNEDRRVLRGGSWFSTATSCRAASRDKNIASYRNSRVGFRVALRQD